MKCNRIVGEMNLQTKKIDATSRMLNLDALRGVAVLMVFFYHIVWNVQTAGLVSKATQLSLATGMFGVDLFYVLSGFFITKQVLMQKVWAPWDYLRARIRRIYPAYLFSLIVCAIYVIYMNGVSLQGVVYPFFMHLLMLHNLWPRVTHVFNDVYWTLGVEFPYYILMLFLANWLRSKWKFLIVAIFCVVLAILYRAVIYNFVSPAPENEFSRFFLSTQLIGVLDAFFIGGLVAYLYVNKIIAYERFAKQFLLISICLSVLVLYHAKWHLDDYWVNPFFVMYWRTLLALAYGLVIYFCLNVGDGRWVTYSGLPFLGKISFSFYIWHYPIIRYFAGADQPVFTTVNIFFPIFIKIFLLSIVVAWMSWFFIENRFLSKR